MRLERSQATNRVHALPVSAETYLPPNTRLKKTNREHQTTAWSRIVEEFVDTHTGTSYYEIEENPRLQIVSAGLLDGVAPVSKIFTLRDGNRTRFFSQQADLDNPDRTYSVGELIASECLMSLVIGGADHLVKSSETRHGVSRLDESIRLFNGKAQRVEGSENRYAAAWFDFGSVGFFKKSFVDSESVRGFLSDVSRFLSHFQKDLARDVLIALELQTGTFLSNIEGPEGYQFVKSLLARAGIPNTLSVLEEAPDVPFSDLAEYMHAALVYRTRELQKQVERLKPVYGLEGTAFSF